jgi:hypothetical protein
MGMFALVVIGATIVALAVQFIVHRWFSMSLTIVVFVVVVTALAFALAILWDRLVGTVLVGVLTGTGWMVARSKGRWWFWPVLALALFAVIAALVVAVVLSWNLRLTCITVSRRATAACFGHIGDSPDELDVREPVLARGQTDVLSAGSGGVPPTPESRAHQSNGHHAHLAGSGWFQFRGEWG